MELYFVSENETKMENKYYVISQDVSVHIFLSTASQEVYVGPGWLWVSRLAWCMWRGSPEALDCGRQVAGGAATPRYIGEVCPHQSQSTAACPSVK